MLRSLFACCLVVVMAAGCEQKHGSTNERPGASILVGAAASFAPVLRGHFVQPSKVRVESGGSLALLQRQQQLGRHYDILVFADPKLAEDLSSEQWHKPALQLAQSQLVLAFSSNLKEPIRATEILQAPYQLALANPKLAPLGYRSVALLEAWQLALKPSARERFSSWLSSAQIFPDASLTALSVQIGRTQSALLYQATARAFGLKTLVLSDGFDRFQALKPALREQVKQREQGEFVAILSKNSSRGAAAVFAQLESPRFQQRLVEFGFNPPEPAQ